MDDLKLLSQIRSHRIYILAIMIFGLVAGLLFFYTSYCSYKAVTTIYIAAEPVVNSSDADNYYVDISRVSDCWAIQQMLLNSNELVNTLNTKFKLYKHYNIDSTSIYAYDKLSSIVTGNITFMKKSKLDLFDLSFKDRNPEFAVNLVNYLAQKLNEMNKSLLIEKLKKKASIYKNVLMDLNIESKKLSDNLSNQLSNINMLLKNIEHDKPSTESLINLQNSLNIVSNDLKMMAQKTSNADYAYQIAQKSIDEDSYPIIRVIARAVPTPHSYIFQYVFFGLMGMFVPTFVYIFVLHFISRFKREISMILGK